MDADKVADPKEEADSVDDKGEDDQGSLKKKPTRGSDDDEDDSSAPSHSASLS